MTNLLAFMEALKGNSNFVALTFVLCCLLGIAILTFSIQRTLRRKQNFEHQERIEQKRLDASRSIVAVKQREID